MYWQNEDSLFQMLLACAEQGLKFQHSPEYSVEATRKLANIRIRVDRVIGLLRGKYSILKSTLPVEFLD